MKLSATQLDVLKKMRKHRKWTAYTLQASLGTLSALRRRGLVNMRSELGAFWLPRSCILWWITPAGLAALEAAEKETPDGVES